MPATAAPSAQHILFPADDTRSGRRRQSVSHAAWRRNLPLGAPPAAANDNDDEFVTFGRAPAKHSLTLEALLEWTYRRQRAHQILRGEMDWVLWAMDRAGYIANPQDCRKVHYDAALVHEAVLALGTEAAAMVVAAAMFGDWPAWVDESISRPRPAEPRDPLDDFGYHKREDGTRFRYLKRVFEIVSVPREEYELSGRKKMRRAKTETFERVPVDGCVVEWSPEPEFIEANNRTVVMWETTRPVLAKALRDAPFKDHILAEDPQIAPLAIAANDNDPEVANDNDPNLAAALG